MQNFRKTIKITLTIIAIFTIIVFCIEQPSVIDYLMSYKTDYLVAIFCLYLIFYLVNAYILYSVIQPYGENISFGKVLGINQLSSFINYLLPFRVASIGIKVLLLKKHFSISSGETLGTFTLMTLVYSSICLIIMLTSISFLELTYDQYQTYIKGTFGAVIIILLIILLIVIERRFQLLHFIKLPKVFLDIKKSLVPVNNFSFLIITFLYFVQILITSYMTYILFLGANYQIDFALCLLFTTIGNLSGLLALTPANIGIKELTYIGAGGVFGISADVIVAVLLLDRFIQLVFLSMGLPFFYYLKSSK